jgi:MoaA/NifB/PqqE/SkfB family radical SAM enzyme
MSDHSSRRKVAALPRIPLAGSIDFTYRCNNNCRHCWLRIPPDSPEGNRELSVGEIIDLVEAARAMGCRKWSISGGEPMLRPDFEEIFDHVTSRAGAYTLNTNGTLITPGIARLMKRKGSKLVALYGATAGVHDGITRNPGSFEAMMRGVAYLKEAGAGFTVQIIPMKDNYHQYAGMLRLAESLSRSWRIGASWLYLSASRDQEKNREIRAQRLTPADVVELDRPDPAYDQWLEDDRGEVLCPSATGLDPVAPCILQGQAFHVDPYGGMSFCQFIKDPVLRLDLRRTAFSEIWEKALPELAGRRSGESDDLGPCVSCARRKDCRWCPAFAYLEEGSPRAKVDYLCAVAKETRRYKREWEERHRRYYRIAGITIGVESALPISDTTFQPKFEKFRVEGPGDDNVAVSHYFAIPPLQRRELGAALFRKGPWSIHQKGDSWIYICHSPYDDDNRVFQIAVFSKDYTRGRIYNDREEVFLRGGIHSLTLMPTDQILLAQLVADRQACFIHSSGVIIGGKGYLFVGHSEAGKSTMVKKLMKEAEILCDDRVIVRRWADGFKIHGTWSHGEVPDVSAGSAPLSGLFFLNKSEDNRIVPLRDTGEITKMILPCLIRPFVTGAWWEKALTLIGKIASEVPCYSLYSDKNGGIVGLLRSL